MGNYIRKFEEGELYNQESGPSCNFSAILRKGEVGDMQAGLVKMKGPTWNKPAAHDKWHQFYILLKGKGIMRIGKEKFPVSAPSVIKIPYNTLHAMEVGKDEYVEYVYVNQNINDHSTSMITARLEPDKFVVNEIAHLRLGLSIRNGDLVPGSVIEYQLPNSWLALYGPSYTRCLQTENPDNANYVSVRAGNDARFEINIRPADFDTDACHVKHGRPQYGLYRMVSNVWLVN